MNVLMVGTNLKLRERLIGLLQQTTPDKALSVTVLESTEKAIQSLRAYEWNGFDLVIADMDYGRNGQDSPLQLAPQLLKLREKGFDLSHLLLLSSQPIADAGNGQAVLKARAFLLKTLKRFEDKLAATFQACIA